jgi:hypothetical protein
MLYVEASEIPSRFDELVAKVLAGEEVRFRQNGREVAIHRLDSFLTSDLARLQSEGRVSIPPDFGKVRVRNQVAAVDGGFVGAADAVISERESGY